MSKILGINAGEDAGNSFGWRQVRCVGCPKSGKPLMEDEAVF